MPRAYMVPYEVGGHTQSHVVVPIPQEWIIDHHNITEALHQGATIFERIRRSASARSKPGLPIQLNGGIVLRSRDRELLQATWANTTIMESIWQHHVRQLQRILMEPTNRISARAYEVEVPVGSVDHLLRGAPNLRRARLRVSRLLKPLMVSTTRTVDVPSGVMDRLAGAGFQLSLWVAFLRARRIASWIESTLEN